MTSQIDNYVNTINALPKGNIAHALKRVYAEDIVFSDPAHNITGLSNLTSYFEKLYENTLDCSFNLTNTVKEQNRYSLEWSMLLSHKRLKKGSPITVQGSSFLQFNEENKIVTHHDYFDLGAMLYENVAVIGTLIRFIKGKL